MRLRALCPSIFSSIAIELNVPCDDFSSIAIELTFVNFGHGFKKTGSVLFDIGDAWDNDVLNPITPVCICITGWCYHCVEFICDGPRACSTYSHWYYLQLIWGGTKVSLIAIELVRSQSNYFCTTENENFADCFWFDRDRSQSNSRRTTRPNMSDTVA